MTNELEDLIRQTESDISGRVSAVASGDRSHQKKLPRFSIAIAIWLVVIILAAFKFDDMVQLIWGPTESKIEADLGDLLQAASASLHAYEIKNGVLPPMLPKAAIRGLVQYQRHSDFSFTLKATISDVTVVLESGTAHPHRELDDQ
ncbi:MAG: hypothetical protein KDI36_15705 [Pseudomonadales bacterium]|nr:hypothetical protein [Pseudomonadales bacterium]